MPRRGPAPPPRPPPLRRRRRSPHNAAGLTRTAPRSYPHDLAARVREVWPDTALPLPAHFESILATAYHASFLHDEERPVTCRIMALSPGALPDDAAPPGGLLPLVFDEPRGFDEHELRRLSPAAKYHRALIGVSEEGGALATWGFVQSGPRWLQAANGGRLAEPLLPPCLVVRVARPGHVAVACSSRLVAELRGGRLNDFTLDVFASQWLAAHFARERAEIAAEHRARSPDASGDEVASTLARYVSQQMVKRVIATMRAAHHGGALVIVPPACTADRYLVTKYALRDGPSRRAFRRLMLAILAELDRRAAATGGAPDASLYRDEPGRALAELDEALFELSHLISSLADVDGAVVLTKRFEVLGFGAEIAGDLPVVSEVRRALDVEADAFVTERVDNVGTRHRSAYRLCAAVPQALAVVVSQDGGVRFVSTHRGAVTYWDHGAGDE
jgi:sensor domain DACNV-containing protein